MPIVIPVKEPEYLPVISMDWIKGDAEKWAKDCGLKDPLQVEGPNKEIFKSNGCGYVFIVQEKTGKNRMATARYNAKGQRSYWSMDGIVTG